VKLRLKNRIQPPPTRLPHWLQSLTPAMVQTINQYLKIRAEQKKLKVIDPIDFLKKIKGDRSH
jgi:hypothetical protein